MSRRTIVWTSTRILSRRNRGRETCVRCAVDVETLRRFRAMKDAFVRADPDSPLTPRQRARFRGLAYFAPNPELAVEAGVEIYVRPTEVELVTSSGDTKRYRRVGVAWFEVGGIPAAITLFRSDRGRFFVPFRDATSGTETYGAGRYLEARVLSDGLALIDFNYAYNPYCAYNPGWRCPLPPIDNHLAVPIRAGERTFRDSERTTAQIAG